MVETLRLYWKRNARIFLVGLVVLALGLAAGVSIGAAVASGPEGERVGPVIVDVDGNGVPDVLLSGRVILNPAPFSGTPSP